MGEYCSNTGTQTEIAVSIDAGKTDAEIAEAVTEEGIMTADVHNFDDYTDSMIDGKVYIGGY